ncbi:DUF4920 domain-containing protein [Sphingobacteriaceae bacterium WQ 2009]|uniref:DUF4920 domain-containing protein n=1 Tax=Rhinopithecimicrobium faecis TaxID=2820698 RepID=A0A8T4HAK7_9SPHI|nr:DUF4920 domain-containing protein [Sphingobacteriaceae bacterium WQ 2009]
MKKLVTLSFIWMALISIGFAQQNPIASAKAGVQYGKKIDAKGAITTQKLNTSFGTDSTFSGKIQGEVLQVCKKKGCFITLKTADSAQPIVVRFKDYAYFMPQDIVGKTVVLEGKAKLKETSVAVLRHQAEDLGKPQEEIDQITQVKRTVSVLADGVVVVK